MASLLKAAMLGKRKKCYARKQTPLVKKRKKNKKPKHSSPQTRSEEEKIVNFTTWCEQVGLKLHPNISIGRRGSCSDVGVVATADIPKGVCLSLIPRTALLSCTTSSIHQHAIGDRPLRLCLKHCTSWVPLLIALLAEHSTGSTSNWHHYLSLVPSNDSALPPMLWSEGERGRLLAATGLQERVESDLGCINEDFNSIVLPFMKRHPQQFKKTLHSWQLYHKLVSLVMSYSFTDSAEEDILQRTVMVPFVDLLNHSSQHHVELTFGRTALRLMVVRDIKKGEEIMNTYGALPNASLLQKYGFTESDNPHDVACVPSAVVQSVYLKGGKEEEAAATERWRCLKAEGLLEEEYAVDKNGHPEESFLMLLKLLCAKQKSFEQMKESLLSARSEDDSPRLEVSVECMSKEELHLLQRLAEHCLALFPDSYEANAAIAESCCVRLTPRESYSLLLCIGNQNCLARASQLTL